MTLPDSLTDRGGPSLPGTPNAAVTDAICAHLDRLGVTLHRIPTPEGRCQSVWPSPATFKSGARVSRT
ncbi:hypothetical protein [Paracoccus hibiscisoli]|uniref:Uncharacterized protein n=1 Tax=Paracoccus hibiscisoli TaxID=2023261 RepID=A0A4U0QRT3_9RHOB|nr:hypothetical protein [Paracoccus hibiscisoli]TJZ84556.1 hypothetical protein FA740_08805 [Paracoccus hibiscisoli]